MHSKELTKPDGRHLTLYSNQPIPDGLVAPSPFPDPMHANPHLRWHPLRGEWVTYAGFRQNRTFQPPPQYNPLAVTVDPDNPTELPQGDYEIAVFDNRFPSLALESHDPPQLTVPTAPANGHCEVVVFTQDPNAALVHLPLSRIELLFKVWADRTTRIGGQHHIQYVLPFENRGVEVGVTLHHPHGQIYSYPFVPPRAAAIAKQARTHRSSRSTSLFDEIIAAELHAGDRVIADTPHFLVFTPAAAKWPLEIMVMAKRAVPSFPHLTSEERDDLAAILDSLFRAIDMFFEGVERTPYIAAWNQAPAKSPDDGRLHLQLFSLMRSPGRMKYLAGSESGMGVWVSDTTPESVASKMRQLYVSD